MKRRLAIALMPVAAVALAMAAHSGGSSTGRRDESAAAPLRPHPRVAIALTPGEAPPPTAESVYASPEEGESFQPPSDAEVKRELGELRVAKLTGSGSYVDPLSQVSGLVPERIDMGVDYAGQGPVLALGDGTVFCTEGPGWPGGKFVGITLASGPYAGLSYYVAEDVKPTVHVGDRVQAGEEIAVMYGGHAGIETGWATGHGDEPLAAALRQQSHSGDPGAWSSAAGVSFDRLLVSTGAPSGIPQGADVHGQMPAQYP